GQELGAVRPPWSVLTVAVAGALLLGPVDLLAQNVLPYPWANLANSSAVWALAAFAIGVWVRRPPWMAAAAGVVLLVLAVAAYYLAAIGFLGDSLTALFRPSTAWWMLFGVVAGVVFGLAGALARGDRPLWRHTAAALPTAVLLAEAAVLVYRSGNHDASYREDSLWTAVIEVALAIAVAAITGRGIRQRALALAASVPLAAIGFGAFVLAGFGS
ncbi:MAG: DUF6518 family protein, partial [Stackebrandtia sp.]